MIRTSTDRRYVYSNGLEAAIDGLHSKRRGGERSGCDAQGLLEGPPRPRHPAQEVRRVRQKEIECHRPLNGVLYRKGFIKTQ